MEAVRHDADDRVRNTFDENLRAYDLRCGTEGATPERVADQQDIVPTLLPFLREEIAAERGGHTEHREEVRRGGGTLDAKGLVSNCNGMRLLGPRGDLREAAQSLTEAEKLSSRARADADEAFRLPIG